MTDLRRNMRRLGAALSELKEDTGLTLKDLSVMSENNDPYRCDTPSKHRDGKWLADQMARHLRGTAPIHLRGLHYVLVTREVRKPDGQPYQNNAEDWFWMSDTVARPARWLGYVRFDRIVDERNAPPVIRPAAQRLEPEAAVMLSNPPNLSAFNLKPAVGQTPLASPQAYRLAFFGEKTSLEAVLGPLADEYNADLYLAAGEQTISGIYALARDAAEDKRELIVFVFADCDPAGWQMAVSIAHKLKAFKDSLFPWLDYRLFAPALTVEQVRTLGLPSTPLKASERRASRWTAAFGIEQTEIDALATLNPAELERIARRAVEPFYDATLEERIEEARQDWAQEAQRALDAAARRTPGYARLRTDAQTKLTVARRALTALERATEQIDVDLPEFEMPAAEPDDDGPEPLVSSVMELEEHIAILRRRKAYEED